MSLKRHRKRCHDPEFDPEEEVSNLGSQCDFCGAKLSSRQALIKHKRYWHKNKGWKKPVKTPSKKVFDQQFVTFNKSLKERAAVYYL